MEGVPQMGITRSHINIVPCFCGVRPSVKAYVKRVSLTLGVRDWAAGRVEVHEVREEISDCVRGTHRCSRRIQSWAVNA